MNYKCTRNHNLTVSAAQAIVQGISKDGGLFVPEQFPHYSYSDLCELQKLTYVDKAAKILSDFLSEFTEDEILSCVSQAYAPEKFSGKNPAPLVLLKNGAANMHMLELWHGPTCAFKDMALQLLPHLLTKSLQKTNCKKTALILVATSGDTGKAALEGFKNVDGTKILVFYPQDGVSPMQQRQMNTQEGKNVSVCAIEGNFDDAQTGVKKIFVNDEINHALSQNNMLFSSANSINWGRLLPQIVYYFSSYCDLMAAGKIEHKGQKVNIVVPTGNFGNILAAYYAMKMGLPVNKLICASNSNNVLTEFLRTGVYNRNRPFYTTVSPSMDILVSSNLERLLFDITGGNSDKINGWMNELNTTGCYKVDDDVLDILHKLFYSGFCDDDQTKAVIKEMEHDEKYLCDTHTAVAIHVYQQYVKETLDQKTPAIVVSTASPYKFADSVLSAITDHYDTNEDDFAKINELSTLTGTQIPQPIADLVKKSIRFQNKCTVDKMGEAVLKIIQ